MRKIGKFCVGINDHDVTCQYACRTMLFRLLSGLVCRWKHKSPDGPLSSMQSIDGKLFWILNVYFGKSDRPQVLTQGTCVLSNSWRDMSHVWPCLHLNDQSSKWFRIVSGNLHRMSFTTPGPKVFKWNGLSCMSPECTQGCWQHYWIEIDEKCIVRSYGPNNAYLPNSYDRVRLGPASTFVNPMI